MYTVTQEGIAYSIRRYKLPHGGYNSVFCHKTGTEAYFQSEDEAKEYYDKREFEFQQGGDDDGKGSKGDS